MTAESGPMDRGTGSRFPVPDPTTLTQDLVDRAVENVEKRIDIRLDGLDKLKSQEVRALEKHLVFLETQRVELKNDVKEILKDALVAQEKTRDAALDAQKEAVSKAEIAAEKRSEGLSDKVDALAQTLGDRIDANAKLVSDSVASLQLTRAGTEGARSGAQEQRVGFRADVALGITIVLFLIAVIGFFATRGG